MKYFLVLILFLITINLPYLLSVVYCFMKSSKSQNFFSRENICNYRHHHHCYHYTSVMINIIIIRLIYLNYN